jgi:hypothetical protein
MCVAKISAGMRRNYKIHDGVTRHGHRAECAISAYSPGSFVLIRVSVKSLGRGTHYESICIPVPRTVGLFCSCFSWSIASWAAEPKVQILSPKDGSRITQEQNSVLVSGKVATDGGRTPNVDIVFVIDISGSTSMYAGVDFGDLSQVPDNSGSIGFGRPQFSIGGFGVGHPPFRNLRNSILAAEVGAARRLLLQPQFPNHPDWRRYLQRRG